MTQDGSKAILDHESRKFSPGFHSPYSLWRSHCKFNFAGRFSIGKILVVAQVSLSLLLLIVAALFVRSFQKISDVELGYDRDHLLLFPVTPLEYGYKVGPSVAQLYKDLLERIG